MKMRKADKMRKMRKMPAILLSGVGAILVAGTLWSGCGGDDHHGSNTATIKGNISSVNPPEARLDGASHRWLARLDSLLVGEAIAQASCPALHVQICASNGSDPIICQPVDPTDCSFTLEIDTRGDFSSGTVSFFDDANQNGAFDQGELFAILTNQLVPLCNGTVVTLNDVSANFAALTATAASVVKDPDTCAGTPTATPRATATNAATSTPSSTPTHAPATRTAIAAATQTAAPGATQTAVAGATQTVVVGATQTAAAQTPTVTPTGGYGYGASLHEPPSSWLALASGLGLVGLLVPRRRRRR
jgi:hypothetical protein